MRMKEIKKMLKIEWFCSRLGCGCGCVNSTERQDYGAMAVRVDGMGFMAKLTELHYLVRPIIIATIFIGLINVELTIISS